MSGESEPGVMRKILRVGFVKKNIYINIVLVHTIARGLVVRAATTLV